MEGVEEAQLFVFLSIRDGYFINYLNNRRGEGNIRIVLQFMCRSYDEQRIRGGRRKSAEMSSTTTKLNVYDLKFKLMKLIMR